MEQLTAGTILDERYRIEGLLGEGGFGITYAAENIRIGTHVAIKEFFWRGHVKRGEDSLRIELLSGSDEDDHRILLSKFMQEARTLRDFETESAIVHIFDYFEANHTAYMVMEYLDGITLREYIRINGCLSPETLFRKMIPVAESLSRIHDAGVIHRDITPNNMMILKDGSLKLLDFGSARKYDAEKTHYTAIASDNYAPPEQYDRKGRQGPWTDVYALCATMYECVSNVPPESAVQRMFLDDLKSPGQIGVPIDRKYESVIMKGLSMKSEDRQQSMPDLMKEMRAALPSDPDPEGDRKKLVRRIVLAACAAAAVVIGLSAYHQYDITHKFRNIETEQFEIYASDDMTADQFDSLARAVGEKMTGFAGEDNYEITTGEDTIHVLLPLSCFEGQEIESVLQDLWKSPEIKDFPFTYEYEIKADWESAKGSILAGENQCDPEDLTGVVTVTQVYEYLGETDTTQMTNGVWSNIITDMKTRLDALDTPYAFGTLYGNDRKIVIQTAASRNGACINNTLGLDGRLYPEGRFNTEWYASIYAKTAVLETEESDDGIWGLKVRYSDTDSAYDEISDIQNLTAEIVRAGENRLYLISGPYCIASAELSSPAYNGELFFDTFYIGDGGPITDENTYILDYYCTLINDTSIPYSYYFHSRNFRDENGSLMFQADGTKLYGLNPVDSPLDLELKETAALLEAAGYEPEIQGSKTIDIELHLPEDENCLRDGLSIVKELCESCSIDSRYGYYNFYLSDNIAVYCDDAWTDYDGWEYGRKRMRLIMTDEMEEKYQADIEELWNSYSVEGFDIMKRE